METNMRQDHQSLWLRLQYTLWFSITKFNQNNQNLKNSVDLIMFIHNLRPSSIWIGK